MEMILQITIIAALHAWAWSALRIHNAKIAAESPADWIDGRDS